MGTVVEFKREMKLPKDLSARLDGIAIECVSVMLEATQRMVDDLDNEDEVLKIQDLVTATYIKSVEKVFEKIEELL